MTETLIITTEWSQNNASTLAQKCSSGGSNSAVVAVFCSVFIDQDGSLSTTKNDSTINETQGLKIVEWYSDGENNFNDYIGSETEKAFSISGIMVNPYTYVISGSFDGDIEILNKNINPDIWFVNEGCPKFYPKK